MKTLTTILFTGLILITSACRKSGHDEDMAVADTVYEVAVPEPVSPANTESYAPVKENSFQQVNEKPLSTFSIDVDNASYTNVRRFIKDGQLPPADAVRVEEFINYFTYDYPQPQNDDPFSISTSVSTCPWNKEHLLVQIGLQGKKADADKLPPSNIVFLIDVSGSMDAPNKLPLLKKAITMMVENMHKEDHISMVVYAGAAGLVLPSTSCSNPDKIIDAIDHLHAGGSTAGGEGIELAYKTAQESFIKNGNNRIILATDGDFNVGASSDEAMLKLIEEKRKSGVYLTVLGLGTGNLQDSKMELLADHGNGNYFYIDDEEEAEKVLVKQVRSTLFTIAKDVKLQVEFNPANIKSYRLIGYENRMMSNTDFSNDSKDAGEIGAGHTVTALYEIEPNQARQKDTAQNLRYQKTTFSNEAALNRELLTVKLRYKKPKEERSMLTSKTVTDEHTSFENASQNLRFSAAVASFGMLLRNSEYKGETNYKTVCTWAKAAQGDDKEGYRREFIQLVKQAADLGSN